MDCLCSVKTDFSFVRVLYRSGLERVESVVVSDGHVFTGQNLGSALADNNRTGFSHFSCVKLGSQIFRV